MFHGIFLRRMPSSSDSALHSRPTHRTHCQMQTAIRSLFHSHRTFPLARSPWQRQHSARSCRLSFRPTDTAKKTSLVSFETRQLLTNSSPLFTRRSPLRSSLSLLHTRAYAHSIRFSTLPSPCRRNPLKTLTNRLLQVKPSPFLPSHPNTDNSLTTNYLR